MIDSYLKANGCDFAKLEVSAATRTLSPGTYCNGLRISKGSTVRFNPGIYIIRNGEFKVDGKSTISGSNVAFVFRGEKSQLNFDHDLSVSLSAPEIGLLSGILFYAEPLPNGKMRNFKIQSKDAQRLIGTVYLPAENLIVGGDSDGDGVCDSLETATGVPVPEQCLSDIGTASSWTAIITKKLHVTSGATLVINSDYSNSTVPVPDGIGPRSGRIVLTD